MKGIILAAGKGTRLSPITKHIPKPLLPIYDKPLIYYSLSMLIMAGIKEILVITPPEEIQPFETLLGDGSQIGLQISYREQPVQRGIADAFLVGKEFIGQDSVCLMLSDNIFYGEGLAALVKEAVQLSEGGLVFGYPVADPTPFGVVELDTEGNAISIEEKPENPKSNYIIPGMYFYDNAVVQIAEGLSPSLRGELEITDVNLDYLQKKALKVFTMGEEIKWFDAGTPDSLLKAANNIAIHEKVYAAMIGCIEEEAYYAGFISKDQLHTLALGMPHSEYREYLELLATAE